MSGRKITNALTKQQKVFYEENGYFVIKNIISQHLIDEFRQRFIDVCNGTVEHAVPLVMEDLSLKKKGATGEHLINKLQDFQYDEVLSKYITSDDILDIVQELIGPNITAVHSMLINKPPNAEAHYSVHPLHQDLHYFPFRPADKIVATWTAIENVDVNNGCLYVVPGSHKNKILYDHVYPEGTTNKLYHGVRNMDHLPKVYVTMETGDTVFFHPLLLHGSGPNKTKGFRKAISTHYASNDCFYIDTRGTSQENISEEMENLMKKRKIYMSYQQIWNTKSRLVRGQPGSLQQVDSNL